MTLHQVKTQPAYEISDVFICKKTGKQIIEVKIAGKGQCIYYSATEIVVDNNFITNFSAADVRTITYFATADRYEEILKIEKIKKKYEIIRARHRGGNKTIHLRHIETNEYKVISLGDFTDNNLIDELTSHDAYHLGYLTGQEQTIKDSARLRIIASKNQDLTNE